MCWYTENHKHSKTLDPALQDAYWHGQCHRDKCSWQRRAHSQESRQRCVEQRTAKGQEERLCRCERECFFFLNLVNILARQNGQVHPLSLPMHPAGTETYFDEGIGGKLGKHLLFKA